MPFDYFQQPRHLQIPAEVSGYELAPVAGKGLWSIVSPTGTVTNLNSLGLKVLAYTGAGMPPIENITTALGVLGGSILQRTVNRPRSITLSCIAEGLNLRQVQRIKNSIIAQVAPYNSLQLSKQLKLHYQLVNYCGDLIGTALEVPVTYVGDLTGSNNNLNQDRFDLTFMEWAPPGIKELTTIQPSLIYNVLHASTEALRYRLATGEWKFLTFAIGRSLMYDLNGEMWRGSSSVVTSLTGITSQVTNSDVNALAYDQTNNIYAGGAFTSPYNYIMKYSGSWALFVPPLSTGTPINGVVRAIAFANDGSMFVAGGFTIPQSYLTSTTSNMQSWRTTTSPGNQAYALVNGLDGLMYVGGDFGVKGYLPGSSATVSKDLCPLGINQSVLSLAVLPNGYIVAAGKFTVINGVSINYIAYYNGTQWQQLGNGLNNYVTKLAVNNATGELYATGFFTQSGTVNLTPGFARWNGSQFVPGDIDNSISISTCRPGLAIRQSDGQLALTSDDQNVNLYNGGFNTYNYTGTADVYPQIKFTGPGILWAITNYTTGKSLYFNNYTLLAGETATFTHDPAGGITFISSFYGNILGKILPGSDVTTFGLIPGTNNIVPFIESATGATKVEFIYQNTHYSFESGAGSS